MRDDGLVRRRAARPDRLEQRGLEPPAVLVGPLEIHLRGPTELGPRLEHRRVAAPRVEPDIQDVGLLPEALAAALRAPRACWQERRGLPRVPLVTAPALAEDPRDVLDHLLIEQQRPASLAVERDDRHAPDALARND